MVLLVVLINLHQNDTVRHILQIARLHSYQPRLRVSLKISVEKRSVKLRDRWQGSS